MRQALLLLSIILFPTLAQSKERTLEETFLTAAQRSEAVASQLEVILQAKEDLSQARGAILPNISLDASYSKEKYIHESQILPTFHRSVRLTLQQPLFRGLAEYAAIRQQSNVVAAKSFAAQNAARRLYSDTATAFFTVISLEQAKKDLQQEHHLTKERLNELNRFYKIGRRQLTDVLSVEANIASLEAQIEGIEGNLANARVTIHFLTDWPKNVALQDINFQPLALEPLTTYQASLESRADITSARSENEASAESIAIARGSHLPSLDVVSNYYVTDQGQATDPRWDVALVASLPIYSGGITSSRVRSAQSSLAQAELNLAATRRAAQAELQSAYEAVVADQKQVARLTQLVAVTKKNWKTTKQYFQNGLVTNLEVNAALTSYQEAERQLDQQYYIWNLDLIKLQAASGSMENLFAKAARVPSTGKRNTL